MSLDLTLHPIRTEADYRAALARAEAFFDAPEEPDPESEEGPPRQNTCRPHRTLNPGALMEEQVGEIRTSIQGQGRGTVAAA